MAGHIKLDRKILEWEWYSDANTCRLFIHLLLKANYKESRLRGKVVLRGQVVVGRKALAKDLRLSEQQIRTALNKLQLTQEITIKPTNKDSIVTICKYDSYQSFGNDNSEKITNKTTDNQPTDNQRITTSNKNNKLINKENTNIPVPTGGAFLGLYEKMMEIFKKHSPNYFKDDQRDYPACATIAKKLEILKGWEKYSSMNGNMDAFLEYWDLMAEKASKHKWLGTLPLLKLSDDQWQAWCQHMDNQEKGISSKDKKAKPEKKEPKSVSARLIAQQYD